MAENLEFYPVARRAFNRALGSFKIIKKSIFREKQRGNLRIEKAIV